MSPQIMTETAFESHDIFANRHIGPNEEEIRRMLGELELQSLEELAERALPASIRLKQPLNLPAACGERAALEELAMLAGRNHVFRSYIGLGYHGTLTPAVIRRNVLENPGWYTQYTPYQAEISQGRLEALLNFQTLVCDLTALPVANASLLDEATAAAEALFMAFNAAQAKKNVFLAAEDCHPQTLEVVRTRAAALGIEVRTGRLEDLLDNADGAFGVLLQFPNTFGEIFDPTAVIEKAHTAGALAIVATDPLALTLLRPPGECGADVAIGSTQRFGVPPGFGGPHAAFIACHEELKRRLPGRIVGVSKDSQGNPALRLALQTREQHIRRDKATSNICTSQALPAILASMFAVYHGPEGLTAIARRAHALTRLCAQVLDELGFPRVGEADFFDTLRIRTAPEELAAVRDRALSAEINFREYPDGALGIALDETVTLDEVQDIFDCFAVRDRIAPDARRLARELDPVFTSAQLWESGSVRTNLARESPFLTQPVFRDYHTEHEFLRYVHRLQSRDLSLTTSMIPLGSCTMKLNATSAMLPLSWPEFANLHPYAPRGQVNGYRELFWQLEEWLCEITGLAACSLQPNAGSQGEFAGLLAIRAYHQSRGEKQRNICLIPVSAHGTNPASATIAGYKVVPVGCNGSGDIDLKDLRAKAAQYQEALGALMITYPSTHGVFEEQAAEVCRIAHEHGAKVYFDGANLNALVGLSSPGAIGADVCHVNLHKTFCIPHGGGGPGMGPICVSRELAPFLPGDPLRRDSGESAAGAVAAAPWGSASLLTISWMYIRMMGGAGLTRATLTAILNANYLANRLKAHYPLLYTGPNGFVAHEFILDLRPFVKSAGIEPDDVAKRLMDYGFHAPTMSWPVSGTLMIEPTESESPAELERFCEALIALREEIRAIAEGRADRADNVLKNAPHTAPMIAADDWTHPYSRNQAAYPLPRLRRHKFWPHVGRIDNACGDRNLVCTCGGVENIAD